MSFMDEYNALKKKRQKGSTGSGNEPSSSKSSSGSNSFMDEYNALKAQRQAREAEERSITDRMTVGDIAPVREEEEESIFDGWFKKSESDTASAILGSGLDVLSDLGTGLVGMGEKFVDALAYLAPAFQTSQQAQNSLAYQFDIEEYRKQQEAAKEFIEKDLYDEEKVAKQILSGLSAGAYLGNMAQGGQIKEEDLVLSQQMRQGAQDYLDNQMEKDSVLDEKSDSLVQSGGQLLGTSALSAAGIPWWAVTGTTTFGSEVENAFKQGATYDEAGGSALVSAGAEILTEKISGGIKFGGKTLDDAATKFLARNVSDKVTRTLMKLGMDMAGEGAEEVLSGVMSAVGQKMTYAKEKELEELFTKEDAWEAFIGGAALGGFGSASQAATSAVTGVDAVTELTKNEQKVVDKVYQDELAKRKGKLSEKEKAEIYDNVINSLEKGYISTETIEEALGGESYSRYKQAKDWESSLQSEYDKQKTEYDKLYNMENGKKSSRQVDREAELKAKLPQLQKQLENVKATSTLEQQKSNLSDEVFSLVKGDRLAESYHERARVKQKFEADLSQYDQKYHAAIQRAIDSGVLNNTNRSHELVDLAAKLEADKGMTVDFTNNEKIKNSSFAVEGKIVNGYKTDTGIGINVQSPKYLNTTVGHEITHVLEGTDAYKVLSETIKNYAIAKEGLKGYNARLAEIESLYKGMEGTDTEAELVADLVGDYLFTDSDFVTKLSTEDRNVFQKVWDEIKYLCKVVTAGSKEARELERVKKAFEDAYRADTKAAGGTQNSLTEPFTDSNGTHYDNAVLLDTDFFDGTSPRNWGDKLRTLVNERATNDPFILPITDENGKTTLLQFASPQDRVTKDGASNHKVLDKLTSSSDNISKLAVIHIDEIVSVSEENLSYHTTENNHQWLDKNGWLHRNANVINQKNGNIYNLTVDIAKAADGRTILYATNGKIKKVGNVQVNSLKIKGSGQNSDFGNKVPQNGNGVKHSLSAEQQEYFKDSVVRDENGNLKVMYHGTPNGDFNVFKDGTYFTDNKAYADTYQNPGASSISTGKTAKNPKTFEVYLDIKKPFDIADPEARSIYINEYIKGGNAMGINPYLSDAEYAKIQTIDWTEGEDLREFLMDNGYDYDGLVLDEGATGGYGDEVKSRGKSYVVFSPEQVKNVDNLKPTSNPDIRYSLSDSDGKQLTKEQQDYFKDSKMRDDKGNLMVMYHGSQDAGFHTFDAGKSDDGTSFFFVNRNDVAASYSGTTETYEAKAFKTPEDANSFFESIGKGEYEVVKKDGSYALLDDGDEIATGSLDELYTEFCDYEGVGYGDANYKVYLNLKNPLEVDAKGKNWNNISREYSQEIADRYNSLTAEEKSALADLAEWGEYSIFKDEMLAGGNEVLASAYEKLGGANANLYDAFSIAQENFSAEAIQQFAMKQMTTRDYAQKAKAEGYDGVIFKNIVDNGGYSNGSEGASTVAIAFDSNQIKSVANESPTADKDIRFSLSEPVEETKDLVAVHNLRGTELIKSLELGGLPMPSIAVIKAQASHDKYGEVSLIFPKETIDPKASRANKVYGGDAWTPTYPKIEYKPRSSVEKRIREKYYDLSRRIGYEETHKMARYVNELEDSLNRAGGEAALLEDLYTDRGMMQIYLQDIGQGKVEPVTKEVRTELSDAEVEMNEFFIKELGADVVDAISGKGTENPVSHRVRYWKEHGEKIKDAYEKFLREEYGFTEDEIDNVLASTKTADYIRFVRDARLYRQNGRVTIKTENDYEATKAAIIQAAGDGYKAWIDKLFSGVEEKTGIRNNQNYFDRNGNRRSWNVLHWENTLENVVKAMKAQTQTGADAMFAAQQIDAVSAKEYGSIAEIKADSDRLQTIPEEQYEEIKESYQKRFSEIADRIMDKNIRNPFTAREIAMESVVDAIRASKTPSGILSYLKKNSSVTATAKDVADIISLVNDIANMPTGYFEAKPQRAVGFDEVGVFVIPYDADVKLKQELLNRGYAIAEYDPKVEGDRQRVVNQFEEFKFSLSDAGQQPKQYGNWNISGKDVAYAPTAEESSIAPIAENSTLSVSESVDTADVAAMFPDDLAPVQDELERLEAERMQIYHGMEAAMEHGTANEVGQLAAEYDSIAARIRELEADENQRTDSLTDADVPAEMEAPLPMRSENYDPFANVTVDEITRSTRSYSDQNPGARHFFEEAALGFLYDVNNSTHGERWYNDEVYYATGGEKGFDGTSRVTTSDIAELKDMYGYTWDELRTAAEKVADGDFRSVAAKRVEYLIHKRMMEGYTDVDGRRYEPNREYISYLNETFANEQRTGGVDSLLENADMYAPEDTAPVSKMETTTPDTITAPLYDSKDKGAVKGQQTMFEPPKPNPKVATVLTEESAIAKEKSGIGTKLVSALVDKGMVFENLSLKEGNHELQAKWNYALPSNTEARAQYFMENGADGVTSLKDIKKMVDKSGKAEDFYTYMYHVHNIDRMTLDERFNVENKMVFGETVTADVSRRKVARYEQANPEFKAWAEEVYAYNRHLRQMLADSGVISQETADLWEAMYPHYVPIRRVDAKGQNISVPLDTNKTGVNNPIKRATGGNSDITPLFETMAQRTEQTYRAIARNSFGIELMNTLGSTINSQENTTGVDETIDTLVAQEDHLLKAGTQTSNPTFTVFENGERVEFEITEDMFDALKPAGKLLGYRNKAVGKIGDARRNLLTVWNPVFALYRNPIKDMQEVAINSQHPVKTYLNVPNAIYQMATGGKFAEEYHRSGGKSNTYFDSRTNKFKAEDKIFKKTLGLPVRAIETAGEFIEEIPRLAEYIASRKAGRSVERSMLDSARVTTNFAAGGDFTKFLNSHGFTFLNASVQGASQHVRNFREANQEGMKGYVKVLAKYTIAGLPGILLNSMLWDDDEDYEELNDYVKQNYYVVAKTEDGKFIRIPKGRTAAVMQNAMEQMQNLVTGNDEADFATFYELFMNNIAPNNPIENNILAPIGQVMKNEAWYGGDLVPSRLQNLPAEEQFDESTDSISKWLGEKTGFSPYKINYLIDQYSGGLGDTFLPMLTPEAESGDNTFMGNLLAPWKKELTTDSVLNNKNPGDFYDLRDELEIKSNSSKATVADQMKAMYMDSVSWEMSDLYAKKREIQNSDLPDDEKYEAVRNVQEQINELSKNAMDVYDHVRISGLYSEVGDKRYNKNEESGEWYEIREKNSDGSDNYYYQKEQEVTKALGISYGQYWNNREEYNFAYDKPEQYALAESVGGYDSYRSYTSELWDIKADKDENGKSISGSRKTKVIDYLNELDIDYYHKIILFKNEYNADDTYNEEIIEYLNGRDDISYKEMESILKYLGFEVDSQGNISW